MQYLRTENLSFKSLILLSQTFSNFFSSSVFSASSASSASRSAFSKAISSSLICFLIFTPRPWGSSLSHSFKYRNLVRKVSIVSSISLFFSSSFLIFFDFIWYFSISYFFLIFFSLSFKILSIKPFRFGFNLIPRVSVDGYGKFSTQFLQASHSFFASSSAFFCVSSLVASSSAFLRNTANSFSSSLSATAFSYFLLAFLWSASTFFSTRGIQ